MERHARRIITIGIILSLALSVFPCSMGEQATWDCPECGRKGNTGNYCGSCAHPAPWNEASTVSDSNITETVSNSMSTPKIWDCPGCGIIGIIGNYCEECFYPAPWIEQEANIARNIQHRIWIYHAVGQVVTFGHYEQDNDASNGTEEIEWIVLKYNQQTHNSLLVSRYGLDTMPFDTSINENDGHLWESCTLNTWLNNEFKNDAFSLTEQSAIVLSDNADGVYYPDRVVQNPIFILSSAEMRNEIMLCTPTDYAIAKGAYNANRLNGSHYGWWWLRNDGQKYVNHTGIIIDGDPSMINVAVRPAIWLNLEALVDLKIILHYKQVNSRVPGL